MTIATVASIEIHCPVHADVCAFKMFPQSMPNVVGNIIGLCEKCGYQIEQAEAFGVRYRRLDDPSVTLSREEFERTKP